MVTILLALLSIKAEERIALESINWVATSFTSSFCHYSPSIIRSDQDKQENSIMSKLMIISIFVLAACITLGSAQKQCAQIYQSSAGSFSSLAPGSHNGAIEADVLQCCGVVKTVNKSGRIICDISCDAAVALCISFCAPEAESCGPACVLAGAACLKACRSGGGV